MGMGDRSEPHAPAKAGNPIAIRAHLLRATRTRLTEVFEADPVLRADMVRELDRALQYDGDSWRGQIADLEETMKALEQEWDQTGQDEAAALAVILNDMEEIQGFIDELRKPGPRIPIPDGVLRARYRLNVPRSQAIEAVIARIYPHEADLEAVAQGRKRKPGGAAAGGGGGAGADPYAAAAKRLRGVRHHPPSSVDVRFKF